MWHRLADVLGPWYEQIHRHCLDAGVLHADETGWRVEGRTWWLWCFTATDATFYLIDESRGHPALDQFFVEEFGGVLVSDFWAAYDAVGRTKQKCWPHLLRELKEVDAGSDSGGDWPAFAKRLRRVYGDAVRLELTRGVKPPDGVRPEAVAAARPDRRLGDRRLDEPARPAAGEAVAQVRGGVADVRGVRGRAVEQQPRGA